MNQRRPLVFWLVSLHNYHSVHDNPRKCRSLLVHHLKCICKHCLVFGTTWSNYTDIVSLSDFRCDYHLLPARPLHNHKSSTDVVEACPQHRWSAARSDWSLLYKPQHRWTSAMRTVDQVLRRFKKIHHNTIEIGVNGNLWA